MSEKPKTIMVFGVFDIIHDGHRHFLKKAKELGGRLVAVVATDASALSLKGFAPTRLLAERMKNLSDEGLADEVISGDESMGSWKIFSRRLPDIVALGYDQARLGEALSEFIAGKKLPVKCVSVSPHSDRSLHSSVLRENPKT